MMDAVTTAESEVERVTRETVSERETARATEVAALKAALEAPRATAPLKACSNVRRSTVPPKRWPLIRARREKRRRMRGVPSPAREDSQPNLVFLQLQDLEVLLVLRREMM
jgi:hypothetical protein